MTGIIRDKRFLVAAVTIAVLAAVIFIAGALSSPGKRPERVATDTESALRADYDSAVQAARAGETTRAVTLLESVLRRDPADDAAKRELERLRRSAGADRDPQADPSGTDDPGNAGDPPAAEDPYASPRDDLAALLPATVDGYRLTGDLSGPKDAQLTLEPMPGSELARQVSVASITVYDAGSIAEAASFVDGHGKAYPVDLRTVTVGAVSARSGADRGRAAAVSFARGRFAFEVVLTAASGDPSACIAEAVRVASLIPAAE